MIKALILDLDNTIYPVQSIGENLFRELFSLIESSGEVNDHMDDVKKEIMRRPFQMVARDFGFSEALTEKGIQHLTALEYSGPIKPFDDYSLVADVAVDKFLVTTGFLKLQNSKIDGMGLRHQFLEVHVVDPMTSDKTKKDVFADILSRFGYAPHEIMVVGDDPASELKAGAELGLPVVMYDALGLHSGFRIPDSGLNSEFGIHNPQFFRISHYKELLPLIS